ncbi:MAG TPA: methyltransferase domain-containing protein [Candidatus Limnocylindria bacterium]|nr:methyltransferase domain-containing protein [Candidatus Limnocylindria bacterium]
MRLRRAPAWVRAAWLRRRARAVLRQRSLPLDLCLGSGEAPLPGWVNVDLQGPADVLLDLRFGIPLPDRSVRFIYSEHFIEHLDLEDGLRALRECRRMLMPEGVMRIACPDLEDLARDYQSDWRRHAWVQKPEYTWVDTGARMLNVAMRDWDHRYLYDMPELSRRLREAGFSEIVRKAIGESEHPRLRGLETRPESALIVEAWGS